MFWLVCFELFCGLRAMACACLVACLVVCFFALVFVVDCCFGFAVLAIYMVLACFAILVWDLFWLFVWLVDVLFAACIGAAC